MITDRFVRNIWAVNGVIFLGFFLLVLGWAIIMAIGEWAGNDRRDEVIVGKELEEAKEAGLILQGVEYDDPVKVFGSNGYILPVRVKTYEKPREQSLEGFSIGSDSYKLRVESFSNTVNILFLDRNLEVTHRLIDKRGFIESFDYPQEPFEEYYRGQPHRDTVAIRHITYQIAFEDTDKNGVIDENDNSDLYLPLLDGQNLIQVTTDLDVLTCSFSTSDELLIAYHKRTDEPDEHKRKYFAHYSIKDNKLEPLTGLDNELTKIEELIAQ